MVEENKKYKKCFYYVDWFERLEMENIVYICEGIIKKILREIFLW